MKRPIKVLSMILLAALAPVGAQSPVSGLGARRAPAPAAPGAGPVPTTSGGASTADDNSLRLAIPAGAGATVNDSAVGSAGPLIGFQVWKLDDYLVSTFFTFAPTETLAGTRRDFGSFLLSPPGRGTSFTFAGSKVFPIFCKGCAASHAPLFVGFGGRAGITNTTWTSGTGDAAKSNSGSVAFFTPSLIATSKTYSFVDDKTGDVNEYQFGLLGGYGVRHIAGDLAFSSNADFRRGLVGTDRTTFKGPEIEFFVRMNSFKPYFRYSRFTVPKATDISGLSGGQIIFGVDVLSTIFQKTLK